MRNEGRVVLGSDSDSELGGRGGRRMNVPEDGEDREDGEYFKTLNSKKRFLDKIVLASQN